MKEHKALGQYLLFVFAGGFGVFASLGKVAVKQLSTIDSIVAITYYFSPLQHPIANLWLVRVNHLTKHLH